MTGGLVLALVRYLTNHVIAHIPVYAVRYAWYRRVLGMGIVGAGAGELIAEGVLAVEMGAVVSDLKLTIHPHPTLSETVMETAEIFFGQSTHAYRPRRR